MAARCNMELFANAVIDLSDMTITEICTDNIQVHSLMDLLKRWDGIDGVTLTLTCRETIQGKRGDVY